MRGNPKLPLDSNLVAAVRKIIIPYQLTGMFPFYFHNSEMKISVFLTIYSILLLPVIMTISLYCVGYYGQPDAVLPAWLDIPSMLNPMILLEVHPVLLLINRNWVIKMIECLNEVARRFTQEDTIGRYARFHYFEMTLTQIAFAAMATLQYLLIPSGVSKRIIACATLVQCGLVFTLLGGLLAMTASALHTLRVRVKRLRGIADFETAVRDYEKIADAAACFKKFSQVNFSLIITKCFVEMNLGIFWALLQTSRVVQLFLLAWAAVQLWTIWRVICASVSVGDQADKFYSHYRAHLRRQGLDDYVPQNAILYMFVMRRTRIKFTGFGMFKLDRKFFFSVILATSTYTIMLKGMVNLPQLES